MKQKTTIRRRRIRARVRAKIYGRGERPRLSVYKSNRALYVQVVDDTQGRTLVHATSQSLAKGQINQKIAAQIGENIAKAAQAKGITRVVFDRGIWPYHGKIKALAEGARKEGLQF